MIRLIARIVFAVWIAVTWIYGLWVGAVEEHYSQGVFLLVVVLGTEYFLQLWEDD